MCVQRCVCPELAGPVQDSSPCSLLQLSCSSMMVGAALCAALAAIAAFAAAAAYAHRVLQKLADVEAAVWFYADKVQAGEFRQDRAAGLQNDVSRKIMQAFQQCREGLSLQSWTAPAETAAGSDGECLQSGGSAGCCRPAGAVLEMQCAGGQALLMQRLAGAG